jgi:hypothetical protein
MIRPYLLAVMGCALSTLAAAGDPVGPDAPTQRAQAVTARLPLRFERNQGQFDPAVRYAARASAFALALTAQGASLSFPDSPRVSLSLAGSAVSPAIEPEDPQAARTDYLVGDRRNWHTGVASFGRVRYRSVYPGVDLIFYGNASRLEYDFVLQPGADPAAIRLRFDGAGKPSLTAAGDLALETPGGRMLQHKPVLYQQDSHTSQRRAVYGRYTLLAGGLVGIQVDRYNTSQPLVIDPVITYTTLMGGGGAETMAGMKIRAGLMYIVGSTGSGDWAQPSLDIPYDSQRDCFIEIIDISTPPAYKLKYFTYLGGSNNDTPLAMDVDTPGFVYLTGYTSSTDFPMQGNALVNISSGNATQNAGAATTNAVFLSKLDPNQAGTGNSLVFSTYLSGTLGDDQAEGLAVGPNGIAYLIGTTKSADFPITPNAYAASLYGPSDCFLAQVDTINAILLYSTFFGSELDDDGRAIVLAPNGLVYFAGTTLGTQFPVAGAAYSQYPFGNYDVVIGAFDLTQSGVNSLVYGTYFGGSEIDEVKAIALDSRGRLVVTGYTLSPDFPVTALTAVQAKNHGNADAFVSLVDLRLPASGFVLYSTFLGGSDGEVAYGVTADSADHLYVTGYTLSSDFPVTANAPQPNWGGGTNLFVTRINPAIGGLAGLDYSTYIGLDNTMVGCCLVVGTDGSLFVGGFTEGYLPLLPGYTPLQSNYGGGFSDDFLMVLSPPASGVTGVNPSEQRIPPRKGRRAGEPPAAGIRQ